MNYAVCDLEGKIRYRLTGMFAPEALTPYTEMGLVCFEFEEDISGYTHVVDGVLVKAGPSIEDQVKGIIQAVQRHLDATAQTRNYDGILSLASYATSTDPVFRAEGEAGAAWRDACWRTCYQGLAEVQAGTRPMPTPEEAIAALPPMVWPTV